MWLGCIFLAGNLPPCSRWQNCATGRPTSRTIFPRMTIIPKRSQLQANGSAKAQSASASRSRHRRARRGVRATALQPPSADGPKLTARNGAGRIAFLDFQCSAPKSVSLLAVTFGDERLRQAHRDAVGVAFAELERFAARRVRGGDAAWSEQTAITGNLCAARFEHDASRALDSQLHTHLVTANATFDAKADKWFALTEREMVESIRYAGKVYRDPTRPRHAGRRLAVADKRRSRTARVAHWIRLWQVFLKELSLGQKRRALFRSSGFRRHICHRTYRSAFQSCDPERSFLPCHRRWSRHRRSTQSRFWG